MPRRIDIFICENDVKGLLEGRDCYIKGFDGVSGIFIKRSLTRLKPDIFSNLEMLTAEVSYTLVVPSVDIENLSLRRVYITDQRYSEELTFTIKYSTDYKSYMIIDDHYHDTDIKDNAKSGRYPWGKSMRELEEEKMKDELKSELNEKFGAPKNNETINHPSYYNAPGRKECIEEMIDIWGEAAVALWCEMTAYKYAYRMGCKDGEPEEKDRNKCAWYMNKRAYLLDNIDGKTKLTWTTVNEKQFQENVKTYIDDNGGK